MRYLLYHILLLCPSPIQNFHNSKRFFFKALNIYFYIFSYLPKIDPYGRTWSLFSSWLRYCLHTFYWVNSFYVHQETGYQYSTDEMFGRMCIVASIKCRWPLHPGYMHSFGITEHYFVIVEQPLSISLSTAVVNRFKGDPLSSALKWFQNCPVSNNFRCT